MKKLIMMLLMVISVLSVACSVNTDEKKDIEKKDDTTEEEVLPEEVLPDEVLGEVIINCATFLPIIGGTAKLDHAIAHTIDSEKGEVTQGQSGIFSFSIADTLQSIKNSVTIGGAGAANVTHTVEVSLNNPDNDSKKRLFVITVTAKSGYKFTDGFTPIFEIIMHSGGEWLE